ncbi:glycosyltransferase family 39 protein [Patescibacteria group bacterium]
MFEIVILALIFIASTILIHKNFDLAIKVLLVLSVLLHKEVFSIYKWNFLPVRFFMLGLAVVCGLKLLPNIKKYFKDPFVVLLGLLWFVRGASIIFSLNISASLQLFAFFTTILILGITLYSKYINQPEKILSFIKLYIYICFGLTIFGVFQLLLYWKTDFIIGALWNVPDHISRVGSTFWDVNHFAALLALLLPVLGVLFLLEKSKKQKVSYALLFVFMTGMLLLTSSRTAWIIAFFSFLSFITLLLIRKFGKRGILYVLGAIVLITIPLLVEYSDRSSPFRAYVKNKFHYRLDSFASHVMLLQGSYQIFEEFPILGGGYGGFFEHFKNTDISATFFGRDPAALNTRVPPHTIWGELMAETGIVGLGIFIPLALVLLIPLLVSALKLKDLKQSLISNAMFSALLGILIAGVFYSYNGEFFWLVVFFYFIYGVSVLPKDTSEIVRNFFQNSKFWFVILIVISAFLIFFKLGSTHLIPWDEAIYAKVAKNMVQLGDYISLRWDYNNLWFEKPPFGIWTQALTMNLIGISSLAARLPSAIFGFGTIILVYFIAKKYFGPKVGFVSGLSLLTTFHFLQYSRYAMLDVTSTFFMTLAMYLYLKAKEQDILKFWIFSGISVGFAVMTKGIIGFLPFVIIGGYELYLITTQKQKLLTKRYLHMFGASAVVFLPWHLLMTIKYKSNFISSYLIYHVFDRATTAVEDKGQPIYWYFVVLKVSMRLWFISLLGAFPFSLYQSFKRKDKKYTLLIIWSVIIFMFFSLAQSKIVWYIIPIYPVLAIINGVFAVKVIDFIAQKIKNPNFITLELYLIVVVSLGYLFATKGLIYTPDLTGPKARLLELRDQEFPTRDALHIHAIELPLILYYTDRPFSGFDFHYGKGRIPLQEYDQKLIILAKRGRFPGEDALVNGKEGNIVGEDGDYVLWYYKSNLDLDRKQLGVVVEHRDNLSKDGVTAQEQPSYDRLTKEIETLKAKVGE